MSKNIYKITMNDNGKDRYNNRTIEWDPKFAIMGGDDKPITPALLLAHELGHAYADATQVGPSQVRPLLETENQNLKVCENPIANELGLGKRADYFDWQYAYSADGVNDTKIPAYNKTIGANEEYLKRLGGK